MNIAEKITRLSEHIAYAHSFLHWVIIQIRYSSGEGNHYESYRRFFADFSGLEFAESKYESMKTVPVRIKAGSGGASLKLDDSFIQIKIRGDYYKNFKTTVSPFLLSISALLDEIGASISKIEIRKINLWGYRNENKDFTKEIMQLVLSPELNECWNPEKKDVAGNEEIELTRLFGDEWISDYLASYVIAFGYIKPVDDMKKIARVILDLQAEIESKWYSDQIMDMFNLLNNRLYDIFHWGISEKSINILRHE